MAATEWSVSIDTEGPEDEGFVIHDDIRDALVAQMSDLGAVVWGESNRLGARFNVMFEQVRDAYSENVREAMEAALENFHKALERVSAPTWPVVNLTIETIEEQDRELSRPLYPELVGVAEAAEILEVSKQRVSQLVQSAKPRFPAPMFELAATPVWTKWQIERFKELWDRTPGRPRKPSDTLEAVVEEMKRDT